MIVPTSCCLIVVHCARLKYASHSSLGSAQKVTSCLLAPKLWNFPHLAPRKEAMGGDGHLCLSCGLQKDGSGRHDQSSTQLPSLRKHLQGSLQLGASRSFHPAACPLAMTTRPLQVLCVILLLPWDCPQLATGIQTPYCVPGLRLCLCLTTFVGRGVSSAVKLPRQPKVNYGYS